VTLGPPDRPGAAAPGEEFELELFLKRERAATDLKLAEIIEELRDDVPRTAHSILEAAVLAEGKRVRPILCFEAVRIGGGAEPSEARRVACALELIHAYSLVHDDLPCMDDAPLRRGRPTPHTVYGAKAAAAVGAVLIPIAGLIAYRSTLRSGRSRDDAAAVLEDLMRASGIQGMVGGQALDLEAEGRDLDLDSLDGVHRMKTGALLTASLTIGARVGGADEESRLALERFGTLLGLAFQISDDVLDATSSAEALGKEPSDDALDKATYPTVLGLERSRERAEELVQEGIEILEAAGVSSDALVGLARYVVTRGR
jgi:geranylgeranyl diphosphate synthase type II